MIPPSVRKGNQGLSPVIDFERTRIDWTRIYPLMGFDKRVILSDTICIPFGVTVVVVIEELSSF